MMTGPSLLCCLFLLLGGVFGDTDEVKTVSVTERETVTLHIKPEETQGNVRLWWRFNSEETPIASLDKETSEIKYNDDARFKDRLQVDVVSGSLTLRDSRTTDSGDYQLEIRRMSGDPIYKMFNVTVSESSQESHSMNPGWWGLIVPIILIVPAGIYFIYHKIYKKGNGVL